MREDAPNNTPSVIAGLLEAGLAELPLAVSTAQLDTRQLQLPWLLVRQLATAAPRYAHHCFLANATLLFGLALWLLALQA